MSYIVLLRFVSLMIAVAVTKMVLWDATAIAQAHNKSDGKVVRYETDLIEGGAKSVPTVVAMICDRSESSYLDARKIIAHWEGRSWSDPAANRAVDELTLAIRNLRSRPELWERHRVRFDHVADILRIVTDSRDEARDRLVEQGAKLYEWRGRVTCVELVNWHGSPRDWRYIAAIASDELNTPGLRIRVVRLPESPAFLTECLKNLRQARPYKLHLHFDTPVPNREGWQVLSSFPRITTVIAQKASFDVRDEDLAHAVSQFQEAGVLILPPPAGRLTIEAAAKLPELRHFHTDNQHLTEVDLQPFGGHKAIRHLSIASEDGIHMRFFHNGDGTGEWDRKRAGNGTP